MVDLFKKVHVQAGLEEGVVAIISKVICAHFAYYKYLHNAS